MKYLINLNLFAVGLPVTIGLISILLPQLIAYALLSTMITGALQIIIAFILLYRNPRNYFLYFYFAVTILFFTLLSQGINDAFIWFTPPFLALYITSLIYVLNTSKQ